MVNLLMCRPPIVLQHVVIDRAGCARDLLRHRQDLGELVVGDVGKLCAVVLGDDELWVCG